MDLPLRYSLCYLYTFTGLRPSWISLFSYILGFTGLTFRELSPCMLLVCLSEWTIFFLLWMSVSKRTSPQRKFRIRWSVQPLRPNCKILLSYTVFSGDCGELVPKLIFFSTENIDFLLWESGSRTQLVSLALFFQFVLLCFQFVSQSRKFGNKVKNSLFPYSRLVS